MLISAAVTYVLGRVFPPPLSPLPLLSWFLALLLIGTAVFFVATSAARRVLPLAVLLNMSLVFPDGAPSRFAMARRKPSARQLQVWLRDAEAAHATGADVDRAQEIVQLALALSAHDARTRGHSERVRIFADMIAEELHLDADSRDRLHWAALLHDIGKLAVPSAVLNKPGKPDEREWELIKGHPTAGSRLVRTLMPWFGDELGGAVEHHHERFDGTGYPHGLSGESISLGGRIVGVADAFEVMTAARPYKRPLPASAAREELVRCSGSHFDPAVVRAFMNLSLGRLWVAIGGSAVIAQVPVLARLPERLGDWFTPATRGAQALAAGLVVTGTLTAAGAFDPYDLITPVRLASRGDFTKLYAPLTADHLAVVGRTGGCIVGSVADRAQIYVDGCDGWLYAFSLYGGRIATAPRRGYAQLTGGMAVQGGRYYANSGTGSNLPSGIYEFDPTTLQRGRFVAELIGALGLAADPQSGDLFVGTLNGIYRVHPRAAGLWSTSLLAAGQFDGITVSWDGSTIYAAGGNFVYAFSRSGRQIAKVDLGSHEPDGVAVVRFQISFGGTDVSDQVFVDNHDGTLVRLDVNHGYRQYLAASGGIRGDIVTVGSDGCLYASQGPNLDRLEPCMFAPTSRTT